LVSFGSAQAPEEDEGQESLVLTILKSIWPVLLITVLVIFLSSMRLLSAITRFLILMVVKRQTEQPPMPSKDEQEAGEGQ